MINNFHFHCINYKRWKISKSILNCNKKDLILITELYRVKRPTKFSQVIGQPEAIGVLTSMGKTNSIPHALLFTGWTGTGKTTVARILSKKLKCVDSDCQEINAASSRGIDTIRNIQIRMNLSAMSGGSRMWIFDECHMWLAPVQNALLKMLEDPPSHVYFVLCTTDPHKLLSTIKGRCTEIKFSRLSDEHLKKVITNALVGEKKKFSEDVINRIVTTADGSARKALVTLNKILGIDDEMEQLATVVKTDYQAQAIEICRVLTMANGTWANAATLLRDINDEPEQVRRMVLSYCTTMMIGNTEKKILAAKGERANKIFNIMNAFSEPYYNTDKAGLIMSCWEAMH